jgi:hypothetical protein
MKRVSLCLICLTLLAGCITPQGRYDIDINQAIAITQLALTTAEHSLQLYIAFQDAKPEEVTRRQNHIDLLREHLHTLLRLGTPKEGLPSLNELK